MQWFLVVAVALCLATSVQAQDSTPPPPEETPPMPVALAGVDGALAKRMQRNMQDVAEAAMTLIMGYGRDGAIDRAGIETWISVERALARSQVMRRMVEADLDADGRVTAAEIAVIVGAAEAGLRGRIMQNHRAADADADGTVDADEAAARATAVAMNEISEADAIRSLALLGLDLDGDGRLTLAEVDEAVALMAAGG